MKRHPVFAFAFRPSFPGYRTSLLTSNQEKTLNTEKL
jgi:hypothetical protein